MTQEDQELEDQIEAKEREFNTCPRMQRRRIWYEYRGLLRQRRQARIQEMERELGLSR